MSQFVLLEGVVTSILPMQSASSLQFGCGLMFEIQNRNRERFQVVVSPDTYVYNQEPLRQGDPILAFYDSMAPMPLIYPPQYRAVAVVKNRDGQQAALDYFNTDLTNTDRTLQLTPSSFTSVALQNGQQFTGSLANRLLLALYTVTTRSIPARTTPSHIVVFCN